MFKRFALTILIVFTVTTLAFGHGSICSSQKTSYDNAKSSYSAAKTAHENAKKQAAGNIAQDTAQGAAQGAVAGFMAGAAATVPAGGSGAIPGLGIGLVIGGSSSAVGSAVGNAINIWRLGRAKGKAKDDCDDAYHAWSNCMWSHILNLHYSASGSGSQQPDHSHSVAENGC